MELAALLLAELRERRVADGPVVCGVVLGLGVADEDKCGGHGEVDDDSNALAIGAGEEKVNASCDAEILYILCLQAICLLDDADLHMTR
mgnify:CR=1 FL=1